MAEATQPAQASERPSSIYTTYLHKADEITRALKTLRDQRAALQLRFSGDSTLYTAKILDVSNSELLLEDIRPRSGRQLMTKGRAFSFSGRSAGLYVHSEDNQILKIDAERGLPFYRISPPTSVLCQQRRRTARFRLPLRVLTSDSRATLVRKRDNGHESLVGRVIDISAGGCRVEIDGPMDPPIATDEELRSCVIKVPKLPEFDAKGAIRHFNYNKKSNTLTCGIELTEMSVTNRRRLEHFIQTLSKSED
jgi:c-di-GMP-binding flagellar brake protein YcgR